MPTIKIDALVALKAFKQVLDDLRNILIDFNLHVRGGFITIDDVLNIADR